MGYIVCAEDAKGDNLGNMVSLGSYDTIVIAIVYFNCFVGLYYIPLVFG